MLLTYLAVMLVVVVILYGSFRALGGGQPVAAEDYRTVLGRLAEFTGARAAELRDALQDAGHDAGHDAGEVPEVAPAPSGGRAPADPMTEAAGAARKKLGAYLQQLARLELAASEEERPALEEARAQLEVAVEDLGWACRMVEAGVYRDNPGIRSAVDELCAHGEASLAAVVAIVGTGAPGADQLTSTGG